jgi:hypothetical protein
VLTDLLTRLGGAGQTARDTGDAQRNLRLVSETHSEAFHLPSDTVSEMRPASDYPAPGWPNRAS